MRAALYPRVSSDLQRGNYSIPSQINDMVSYALEKGYTLTGNQFVDPETGQDAETGIPAFADDYTSTELSRPGLDACLMFLKRYGFDVLIVHAIDRLARDPYIRQTIEKKVKEFGARVEYVLGNYETTPEGEVKKDLDSTFAKWENAKRVERSNRGKLRKAEMGKFVMGKPPYGYRINIELEGGLEVYEPEADIVRLIFKWYVQDHLSIRQITKELEKTEIRTYTGLSTWSVAAISQMLKNTVYVGYTYYNRRKIDDRGKQVKRDPSEWIKFSCTPIIPTEIFEIAQDILVESKARLRKDNKHFYLLGGMVVCSECSHPYSTQTMMRPNNWASQSGYRHRVTQGHCSDHWVTRKWLEPIVWEKVVQILLDPASLRRGYEKMMKMEGGKQQREMDHLVTLQTGIEKLLAKRKRLQAVYLDPDIGMSKEEYLAEKQVLDDSITAAAEEIEKINKSLERIPTEADLVKLEEMATKMVEALGYNLDIPETEKRRILKLLNLKVILSPNKDITLEGWFTPHDDGLLSTIW
jgi:site-specific DNA recombinase